RKPIRRRVRAAARGRRLRYLEDGRPVPAVGGRRAPREAPRRPAPPPPPPPPSPPAPPRRPRPPGQVAGGRRGGRPRRPPAAGPRGAGGLRRAGGGGGAGGATPAVAARLRWSRRGGPATSAPAGPPAFTSSTGAPA